MTCVEHPSLTFQHRAGIRLYTSSFDFAGPCVFAKQLVEPFYCDHAEAWYALSRSYSVNLPSSFSTAHPSALEYSSRLPVSVYGTGRYSLTLEVFLGGLFRTTIHAAEALQYYHISSSRTDFPVQNITTPFNANIRGRAVLSLPRHPIETKAGAGILTSFPSATPFGFA